MAQSRRMGAEDSEVRARFIDAAEAILCEEGYTAVSARQVAARAGLKTQLLYYYFRTMDDVLLAVVRRVNERRLARFEAALGSPRPLRALWELSIDATAAGLASELISVAHHREAIRAEIVNAARQFRARQTEAIARLVPQITAGDASVSAAGIVMIAAALGRILVTESVLGLTEGHADALAIVEQLLDRFEPLEEK